MRKRNDYFLFKEEFYNSDNYYNQNSEYRQMAQPLYYRSPSDICYLFRMRIPKTDG